ncbi:MAG: hypothetical protein CMJ05_04750 [Pelagibacterales bacterium]|nr:hypothetical protein [Pelagibacterales bacterium]MBT5771685.1 hypothetical protein [Flavobacteriaceae bacterium]MBT7620221.1 hypothetical protein [Flavobacteriales bacterium]
MKLIDVKNKIVKELLKQEEEKEKKNQITKQEYEDIIDELSVFTNLIVDYIIVSECVNLNTKENE